jgi:hypothetical protein
MRRVGAIFGILASLAMLVFSAILNARFGWQLGHTEVDSQIFAGVSIAADVLKGFALFYVGAAWRDSAPFRAAAGSALWFAVTLYSACSAIGFSSINRVDTVGQRNQAATHLADIRSQKDDIDRELGFEPYHRSPEVIKTDMASMEISPKWQASNDCQQASRPPDFCVSYLHMKSELATAEHFADLKTKRDQLIAQLASATVVTPGDPQVAALGDFIPLPAVVIRAGLVWLVAVMIELSSGLGMYASSSLWSAPRTTRDDIVSAKIDALSAKFDRVDEKRNSPSEMPISPDEMVAITLAGPPSKPEKDPQLVVQDRTIVLPQFAQRKALIENRDPSAVPQFADPVLLEQLRALGGTYEGSLRELSGLLDIANSTLHKKLTQAQAAGKIAWRATKGKGTSIKLIEGVT